MVKTKQLNATITTEGPITTMITFLCQQVFNAKGMINYLKEVKKMNAVLELQKLAHDTEGKDQAKGFVSTVGPITTIITFTSTISVKC